MLFTITASVGQNGVNRSHDVVIVQNLLNLISPVEGGPHPLLDVDGKVGPQTIAAIARFQQHQFGWADGRVDPHQKTITRLNEITGRIIAAIQRVLQHGYQILRHPRAMEHLGYYWSQLNQGLQNLAAALTGYAGTELPVAAAPPSAPASSSLVGVAIVDDLTLLIFLVLLLILINATLSSREFKEARDERAKELNRRLEEIRGNVVQMSSLEAKKKLERAKDLAKKMEECQKEHHTENVDLCNEKRERYEKAKKRYFEKLVLLIHDPMKGTRHVLQLLNQLMTEFFEALDDLKDCLGCTNF
jgi:hypothetical protein